jgi:hypothetical protein
MAVVGKKRGLDVDAALHVHRMCTFKTEGTIVCLFAASFKPTIMTRRRLVYLQKKDDGFGDSHKCTTLAGFADSNLLSYDQKDGPFTKATFSSCIDIAGAGGLITYVLENYPAVVRAVNLETDTVTTLKLDLKPVEDPVCIACGPENKLYVATPTQIYVAYTTSDKCTTFTEKGLFSEIQAMCVNFANNTLCVADSGHIKTLSLEYRPDPQVQEIHDKNHGRGDSKITALECDRAGTLYVARKRANELVKIDINGNRTVQRISLATNGIDHMVLTGTGDVMLLTFDEFEAHTRKAKYNVLCVKQPCAEPPYMNDTYLPLKRSFFEMTMREQRILQQRDELQHDLAHGHCTVELDDKHDGVTTKIRVNPRVLGRSMEFFKGWERFPNQSKNMHLHGIDRDVLHDILEFCYTDTLESEKLVAMRDPAYLGPRLTAADQLGFKTMVEHLELEFIGNVTEENAFAMLAFAESMPVKSLIVRMQEYVKTKLKNIAEMSRGAHAELLSRESLQTLLKSFCNQP